MQLRRIFALVLSFALPILYAIAHWANILSTQLAATMFILFTGSCAILAFTIVKRAGANGRLGLLHVGMFTGILLIFLGAVAAGIYAIIFRVVTPFPSVADALNFLGYAFAVLGGFQFLWYFRSAFSQWRFRLIPLLGMLVAGPNLILSHPTIAVHPFVIADATWLAYPILDGVLVTLAIMMVLLFSGGIISASWRWVAIGLILITVADTIVGAGNSLGWRQFVQPFYLFYFWGYICLGLGFSLMPSLERLQPFD